MQLRRTTNDMENDGVGGEPGYSMKRFLDVFKHVMWHMVYTECMSIGGDMQLLYDSVVGVLEFEIPEDEHNYNGYQAHVIDTYLGPMRVANALIGTPSTIRLKVDCYMYDNIFPHGSTFGRWYVPRNVDWMSYATSGFCQTEVTLRLMSPIANGRRRRYQQDTHWVDYLHVARAYADTVEVVDTSEEGPHTVVAIYLARWF